MAACVEDSFHLCSIWGSCKGGFFQPVGHEICDTLFLCRTIRNFDEPSWDPHLGLLTQDCWVGVGLEKEQGVGMVANSWADHQERNEEAWGWGQEMTDKPTPWEEENRRWGWLHLTRKKIKARAFLLYALWLCPLLSQLGDSGRGKLVWSFFFWYPVYSNPYKPQGFNVDPWCPRGGMSLSTQLCLERIAAQLPYPRRALLWGL